MRATHNFYIFAQMHPYAKEGIPVTSCRGVAAKEINRYGRHGDSWEDEDCVCGRERDVGEAGVR